MKSWRLFFLVAIVFACSEDVQKSKSGYFTLTQLKLPKGGRVTTASAETPIEFNLGDLRASREFFFLLGNGGDNAITDITLETNNEAFIVSPSEISSLDGVMSGSSSIVPLISLGVVHGVNLNGVGAADLLAMGVHEGTLTITGKTLENGSTITISSEFTFKVNAKVMDIQLFDGEAEIDIEHPQSIAGGVPFAGGLGAVWGYASETNIIKVKNTGNVDIEVGYRLVCCLDIEPSFVTVTPNNTVSIELPHDPNYPENTMNLISLDSKGAVVDPKRIQLGTDGKGYFLVE